MKPTGVTDFSVYAPGLDESMCFYKTPFDTKGMAVPKFFFPVRWPRLIEEAVVPAPGRSSPSGYSLWRGRRLAPVFLTRLRDSSWLPPLRGVGRW